MVPFHPQKLPHDFPRAFVPREADFGSWPAVEPFFDELEKRTLASGEDLGRWLKDWGEFSNVLDEQSSLRYVRMTCHTDDAEAEKQYLDFLQQIAEPAKPRFFKLQKKYWDCPYRSALPGAEYTLFNRSVENHLSLFRPESVPLETEVEKLSQQYQKLSGSLTVQYEGKEQTMEQMGRYQEAADRGKREEAWRLSGERRLREKDAFEDLFDGMLGLRAKIAANAGFENYRDYMFRRMERFDYTPGDCAAFHESAEKAVKPLAVRIQQKRARKLGISPLRPWDLAVDPDGLPPLKPFEETQKLVSGCGNILGKVDPQFGANFQRMADLGLLDLESRKGKAPGGYQITLDEARLPFIFLNAVGLNNDVRVLLHEGGHAMHAFASRDIPFAPYRVAPIEFCEVASMSMELMGSSFLSEFYPGPQDAVRSQIRHLEEIVSGLTWIACVDAFQHWIYTHPGHSRGERSEAWLQLRRRFGGAEDWSGLEETQARLWHKQLHIFLIPFYYIEYAIAQLGALQVWRNFRRDRAEGVKLYKRGLAVGGSKKLPEIFEAAGIRFDFSLGMIAPLMGEVEAELQRLETVS